jgi:hypothetical protein
MKIVAAIGLVILAAFLTGAQKAPGPTVSRYVQGQTLISGELPSAQITFSAAYRYVGAQVVSLYGNAEAEQHLFVRGPEPGPVQSFYWVQFEHFLPTNKMTYEYENQRPVDINGFRFTYDVKSFRDYAYMQNEDAASDGAAMSQVLAQHHLAFPAKAARVRMIYMPTPDHRTELMIIYGEAVREDSSIPFKAAKDESVVLTEADPKEASELLGRAVGGITIRKM